MEEADTDETSMSDVSDGSQGFHASHALGTTINRSSPVIEPEVKSTKRRSAGRPSGPDNPRGRDFYAKKRSLAARREYTDAYRDCLNDLITEISGPASTRLVLQQSQIGMTVWSSAEKNVFFRSLQLHGARDVQSIAESIGSKSAVEVKSYIMLLERGLREIEFELSLMRDRSLAWRTHLLLWKCLLPYVRRSQSERTLCPGCSLTTNHPSSATDLATAGYYPMPQKWRLSRRLKQAQTLAMPAKLWSKLWNSLIWALLRTVQECLHELKLSPTLLANVLSSRRDSSIFASAIVDLHALAVILTKKLVHTAIFLAASRARTLYNQAEGDGISFIGNEDVDAAVDMLNLRHDSTAFWTEAPRRLGLKVLHRSSAASRRRHRIAYDDVETFLRQPFLKVSDGNDNNVEIIEDIEASSDSQDDSGSDDFEPGVPDSLPPTTDKRGYLEWMQDTLPDELAEDGYLEALDMDASRKEERNMWRLVDSEPPVDLQLESTTLVLKPLEMAQQEVRKDWSEHVRYRPEWDTEASKVNLKKRATSAEPTFRRKRRRFFESEHRRTRVGSGNAAADHDLADEQANANATATDTDIANDGLSREEESDSGDDSDETTGSERSERVSRAKMTIARAAERSR
ncbi:hypothetical protein MRB53_040359 [Persea americana]|nr:hypothetical protein MRB53_040359 [Persea americana]